jgi:hypothetical protein
MFLVIEFGVSYVLQSIGQTAKINECESGSISLYCSGALLPKRAPHDLNCSDYPPKDSMGRISLHSYVAENKSI